MEIGRFLRWTVGCSLIASAGVMASSGSAESEEHANVVTIDHAVPHLSTLGGNVDESVQLFVRELVRETGGKQHPRKAVLMVHGRAVSSVPLFDLRYKDYSWAMELAKAGFDVFMLDLQGVGRSPLPDRALAPMTDPCNVTPAQQKQFLFRPNPPYLEEGTCPVPPLLPPFPYILINSKSEWDELNTVVDYIIAERGVEKVALIGVSRGSIVVGPYAVLHPEKVESLFFQAPNLNPGALPGIGPDGLAPPVKPAGQLPDLSTRYVPCSALEVTESRCPGISPDATRPHRILPPLTGAMPAAMALTTRQDLMNRWNREIQCDGQVEEGVQDRLWQAIMENEELGSTWGPPPAGAPEGSAPEGLMRNRSSFPWGWRAPVAKKVELPTLIVFGEHDTEEGAPGLPLALTSVMLYDTIPAMDGVAKLLFKVACAGHFMPWERQRKILHHLSKQWLKHGSVDGHSAGKFFVTNDGDLVRIE